MMHRHDENWERFFQSAALAFPDGRRVLVPVLGAGSRRWLTREENGGADPLLRPLVSWQHLVQGVANAEDVAIAVSERPTMTSAFEDVVHVVHARSPETQPVSETERRLIVEHVVGPMRAAADVARARDGVRARAARLRGANFADRIDLCFDSVLAPEGARVHAGSARHEDPHTTCVTDGPHRCWHAHGYTERGGREPYIVLGVQRYGRAVSGAVRAFERRMWRGRQSGSAEAGARSTIMGRNAWRAAPGAAIVPQHWLEVGLDAPLVLLGVGLGHEEWDLRWFLEARARVHARMAPGAQPWTFRLTCSEESVEDRDRAHAATPGTDLLDLYVGGTWDDAWARFFDILDSTAPSATARENA